MMQCLFYNMTLLADIFTVNELLFVSLLKETVSNLTIDLKSQLKDINEDKKPFDF
jgi:hypothetical protein